MSVRGEMEPQTHKTVLIVEDAPAWKSYIFDALDEAGHTAHIADTMPKLTGIIYTRMEELGIQVVIADNRLEDQTSLATHLIGEQGPATDVTPLLKWIKETYPHVFIIGLSGWGDVAGADMQLQKNDRFDPDMLGSIVFDLPNRPTDTTA